MISPDFRTMLLEDREDVVMLRAARKKQPVPSNQPHAGQWGPQTFYVLIPCSSPNRRANAILAFDPSLQNRSSDAEVLVLGSKDAVERLLRHGPSFARARVRSKRPPGLPAHLAPHLFTKRTETEPRDAGFDSDADPVSQDA